jgi:hypothetical protein
MTQYKLHAKMSKCRFMSKIVEYLRYVISRLGVKANPVKIKVMIEWPKPNNIKALKGFLSLTSYYCRFIRKKLWYPS